MNQTTQNTKHMSEIIDLGDQRLPPAWHEKHSTDLSHGEWGQRVHTSGPRGQVLGALRLLLNQAQHVAVVCSFLLAEETLEQAILDASARGVRVYIMVASEARLSNDSLREFDRMTHEHHKKLLGVLAGKVLVRSANHFHAKMLLIDPMGPDAQGMLLTCNLTSAALTRNEELAVKLHPTEVRAAFDLAGWAMWETAEHEWTSAKRFRTTKPLGSVTHPTEHATLIATTPERNTLRREVLKLINQASGTLWVSSFGWGEDHVVVQRLCERARDGLQIKVLARIRPAAMPALLKLRQAGAEVIGFKWLHAKALYSNGQGIVMSANFQTHGMDDGFELGVKLSGRDAEELSRCLTSWYGRATWKLSAQPKLREVIGKAQLWESSKLRDVDVIKEERRDLGEHAVKSAEHLESARPALPTSDIKGDTIAHQTLFSWINKAPVLAAKAKELFQDDASTEPYTPRVFRERKPKRKVVVIESAEEMVRALALKSEIHAKAIVFSQENLS